MTISELNTHYQILREELQYLAQSERNQLHFIHRWLAPLLKSDSIVHAKTFVRELVPIIFTLIPRVNPIGCEPRFIQSIIDLVVSIKQHFPNLFDEEEINSSVQKLNEILTTLYCWLGVPYQTFLLTCHLDKSLRPVRIAPSLSKSDESKDLLLSINNFTTHISTDLTELQILSEWIQHLKSNEQSLREISSNTLSPIPDTQNPYAVYESILTQWNSCIATQHANVNVPLLECDPTTGQIQDFRQFGIISPLRLIVQPLSDHNQKDIITFAHNLSKSNANHDGSDIINIIEAVRVTPVRTLMHINLAIIHSHLLMMTSDLHTPVHRTD